MKLRFLAVLAALPLAAACSKGDGPADHAPAAEEKAAQGQTAAATSKDAAAAEKPAEQKAEAPAGARAVDGKIEVKVTEEGFEPSKIEAEAGKPLTMVFTRTIEKTCMTGVVFPELDIKKDLPVGQPVEVTVTPEANGTIVFQCPMGMGKSTVVTLPQS